LRLLLRKTHKFHTETAEEPFSGSARTVSNSSIGTATKLHVAVLVWLFGAVLGVGGGGDACGDVVGRLAASAIRLAIASRPFRADQILLVTLT
jgi:hypothetical protein